MTESSTTILRRMLDERGVEHEDKPNFIKWDDAGQYQCFAFETFERQGLLRVHCNLTPEQAIAATLGAGTCHEVMINRHWRGCGECGYVWENMYGEGFQIGPNYCPMCGKRIKKVAE